MAGSTATLTRSSNFRGRARDIFQEVAYLSDDADGSVPDQDLIGLDDCLLTESFWVPSGGGTVPANSFRFMLVEKVSGRAVYLSSVITSNAYNRDMTVNYTGNWAFIDGTVTLKLVTHDALTACNIGNAKVGTLKLRFNKKT